MEADVLVEIEKITVKCAGLTQRNSIAVRKQERMVESSGFQLGLVGSLALSVAASVSIVICNKALMSTLGFPFGQ